MASVTWNIQTGSCLCYHKSLTLHCVPFLNFSPSVLQFTHIMPTGICFPLSQCCHIYFPCTDLLHCADTEQKYEQVWRGWFVHMAWSSGLLKPGSSAQFKVKIQPSVADWGLCRRPQRSPLFFKHNCFKAEFSCSVSRKRRQKDQRDRTFNVSVHQCKYFFLLA